MKNKEGFTLVELLAVIVILALLIVITANTILPMMKKTKKTGMVTFANRVLRNVETELMINNNGTGIRIFKISELTGQEEYFGCVFLDYSYMPIVLYNGDIIYSVVMFSKKDKIMLKAIGGTSDATTNNQIYLDSNNNDYIFNSIITSDKKVEIKNFDLFDYETVASKMDYDLSIQLSSIEDFENDYCISYVIDEVTMDWNPSSAFLFENRN